MATGRQNKNGDTTAAINARIDDQVWDRMLPHLQSGATIVRVSKLRRSYVDFGQGPNTGGLSDTRLRKLEKSSTIRAVGLDRYALVGGDA